MKLSVLLPLLFSAVTLYIGCKPGTPNQSSTATEQQPKANGKMSPSGITAEYVQLIVDSCSHVDMIFNDFPISISQTEQNAIIGDLTYLSPTILETIPVGCKPLGRKVYNGNGRVLIEADLYFTENCRFMVFIQNEKALFANQLNEKGINFYNNLLQQVQSQYNQQ